MNFNLSIFLFLSLIFGVFASPSSGIDDSTEAELRAVISALTYKVEKAESYLSELKDQLKTSKDNYHKIIVPKGQIPICGDSSSRTINQQIKRQEAELRDLRKSKMKYQKILKKKAQQDAAANP